MKRRNVLSLIVSTMLVAPMSVAAYAQQAYQFGKCEVAQANREAELRAVYITMPDGVKIAADVILPKDLSAEAKLPAVLTQTRYWRATEGRQPTGADRYWVNYGYAVVNTDVRGTGASFGRWPAPWSRDEVRDMGDVVKWIVAQAWSNGKVVTIGTSYTANTAELTSVSNHPSVKAVIPRFSDFDLYKQLAMPGGFFNDFFAREWGNAVAAMDRNEKRGNPPIGVRPVDDDKDRKLIDAAVLEHQQNPSVYEASKEISFRDDRPKGWNASMDDLSTFSFRKEFERSKVPIYGWASWLDAGTAEGALARFMTFNNQQRLVIGPWSHGAGYHASPFLPPNTPTDPSRDAQMKEAMCFFDQYLKGNANAPGGKELIYYTLGEEKWKTTKVWPLPEAKTRRWYFAADNGLSPSAPASQSGEDKYAVDFDATTGTKNRWYTQMGGGDVVYPDRAEADKRLLTYTSAPLEADTEITGHPVVTLQVTSTATDGAFIVYLEDVDESGRVTYITEGMLRAVHRKISAETQPYKLPIPYHSFKRKDAQPLGAGQPAEITFGLYPTSVLIKKGHRIRVALAGADKDTFVRLPAEGTPVITVARDKLHASFIDLPVVRGTASSSARARTR
jgi:putative CocE/NonD family hydrolase